MNLVIASMKSIRLQLTVKNDIKNSKGRKKIPETSLKDNYQNKRFNHQSKWHKSSSDNPLPLTKRIQKS